MSSSKPKETHLIDLAVGVSSGLKARKYVPGATVFMVREECIRMHIADPETGRNYTILIKEEVKNETDTKVQS